MNSAETAFAGMKRALVDERNSAVDPSNVEVKDLITWPSTIAELDDKSRFYGMVTLSAQRGTGKTMLAISSAIEACADGWQVFYFSAEDDAEGIAERFNNFCGSHPETARRLEASGRFHVFSTGRNQTPQTLMSEIESRVDFAVDQPILVVIDSINSLVEMSSYAYLDGLTEFGLWAMLARRFSGGNAAFLIVAETNKSGSVKGEKLPYWSDQVLAMRRSDGSDVVEIELQKSRRTGGVGELGKFIRIWRQGEFISQDEVETLRRESLQVVQGGRSLPASAEKRNAEMF